MADSAVLDDIADIRLILSTLPVREFFTVADIARKIGVSRPYLAQRPWLLPGWGESDVPGKRLWSVSHVRSWLDEKTPQERQAEWEALPASVQKARSLKWEGRS